MENLKILEDNLFSIVFKENPHIQPFKIVINGIPWFYKIEKYGDFWYIITY